MRSPAASVASMIKVDSWSKMLLTQLTGEHYVALLSAVVVVASALVQYC